MKAKEFILKQIYSALASRRIKLFCLNVCGLAIENSLQVFVYFEE